MKTIKWDNAWSLGDYTIDTQHKKLLGLLNRLIISKEDVLVPALEILSEYAATHFLDEEYIMATHDYSLLKEHKKEHRSFISHILDLSFEVIDCEGGDVDLQILKDKLLKFITTWFIRHVTGSDKNFIMWMHANNYVQNK